MKGRISPELEAVLKDPRGREQLKSRLLKGESGKIQGSEKNYVLTVDGTTSVRVKPKTG